jgi:hypothetical protein
MSLHQAMHASPVLARLAELTQASRARLQAVQALIPPAMRASIQAGPVDEQGWCLLVSSTATAAKLRQLVPKLEASLQAQGWPQTPIRIKVKAAAPPGAAR